MSKVRVMIKRQRTAFQKFSFGKFTKPLPGFKATYSIFYYLCSKGQTMLPDFIELFYFKKQVKFGVILFLRRETLTLKSHEGRAFFISIKLLNMVEN